MNFFKSILADDPDPDPPLPKKPQDSTPEQSHESPEKDAEADPDHNSQSPEKPNSGSDSTDEGGVWSFGGLLRTLSTRSESMLETYRRDLQEFGSELKKETELFREVASRAVKDLPNSIEVGTTVSHAIDGVIKSTTEIISQGKDTLLASSDVEPETPDANPSWNAARYSRFESQLMYIQSDPNTFCLEPEDLKEYKKWKSEFDMKEKSKEVENLIGENGSLEGMYKRVVPNDVDHETFWCRYFYKVYKLKQQESVRAKLVKRAISGDDEELSWDVDDNEQESNAKSKVDEQVKEGSVIESSVNDVKKLASDENESAAQDSTSIAKEEPTNKSDPSKQDSINVVKQATHSNESQTLSSAGVDRKEENQSNADDGGKSQVVESSGNSKDSNKEDTEVTSLGKKEEGFVKGSEGKDDRNESVSGKAVDVPIASSQKTRADKDDLDWDEIEDIEGHDDKKATSHVAESNRADLRKRLSVEDDDEDLSWDIEDDNEPVKA